MCILFVQKLKVEASVVDEMEPITEEDTTPPHSACALQPSNASNTCTSPAHNAPVNSKTPAAHTDAVDTRPPATTGTAHTPLNHQAAIIQSNPAEHTRSLSNSNFVIQPANQTTIPTSQAPPKTQNPITSNALKVGGGGGGGGTQQWKSNVGRRSAESLPLTQDSKTGPGTHRKHSHDSVVTVKRSSLHELPQTHLVTSTTTATTSPTSQSLMKSASLQTCPPVTSHTQQLTTSLQANRVTLSQRRKSDTAARTCANPAT